MSCPPALIEVIQKFHNAVGSGPSIASVYNISCTKTPARREDAAALRQHLTTLVVIAEVEDVAEQYVVTVL